MVCSYVYTFKDTTGKEREERKRWGEYGRYSRINVLGMG
jgi:hypothetical protein